MNLLLLLLLNFYAFSQERSVHDLSLGGLRLAEQRLPIALQDFILKKENRSHIKLQWVKDSVQWIRLNEVLLMPRAKLRIQIPFTASSFHVKYLNKVFLLQSYQGKASLDLWVSLFRAEPITILKGSEVFEVITLSAEKSKQTTNTQLIDYSCAPWSVEVSGLDDDYLSVGCQFHRSGKVGAEVPHLEILWSAASYRLEDNSPSPYYASITNSQPVEFEVINSKKEKRKVTIKSKLPKRVKRLRVGFGLGPHQFKTMENKATEDRWTGSYFLYSNLYLSEGVSLRAFDAYTRQNATFNNAGLYYATEISKFFDNRFSFTTLIGAQILTYKTPQGDNFNEAIFPQGGEIVWQHPFGLKNYRMTVGLFFDLSQAHTYQNNWLRFGTSTFVEVNYIKWGTENTQAELWGFSVGFPIFELF
ncbi:MAG: hypothetical protein LW878_06210 [Proteobacteria bacterium]|jgi:hypothetical protein|nr:hypothetical protein [Pseudomonadota bacterium]